MADYAILKAAIAAAIKENGNEEITGDLLQQSLLAMVNSLGVGYQMMGVATPSTNPGTPDQNVVYIAGPGTYSNMGGLVVAANEIAILYYNGTWHKETFLSGLITRQLLDDGIVQLYDGATPIFPRTKAAAVYFGNEPTDTVKKVSVSQNAQTGRHSLSVGNETINDIDFINRLGVAVNISRNYCIGFNTTNKTAHIQAYTYVYYKNGVYPLATIGSAITMDLTGKQNGLIVATIDVANNNVSSVEAISITGANVNLLSQNQIILAVYYNYGELVHSNSIYSVNGIISSFENLDITKTASVLGGTIKKKGLSLTDFGYINRLALIVGQGRVPLQFDSVAKTCTIPQYSRVVTVNGTYPKPSFGSVSTINLSSVENGLIVATIGTDAVTSFSVISSDTSNQALLSGDVVVLASYISYGKYVNSPSLFNVDGARFRALGTGEVKMDNIANNAVTFAKRTKAGELAIVTCSYSGAIPLQFVINENTKTLTIPGGSRVVFGRSSFALSNFAQDRVIDLSSYPKGIVTATIPSTDTEITTIGCKSWDASNAELLGEDEVVIAYYNTVSNIVNSPSIFSVNGFKFGINTTIPFRIEMLSPNFESLSMPSGVSWWNDFMIITINGVDELWLFTASPDDHSAATGKIYRVRLSDLTLIGSINHNFGHCNTVHYNPNNDCLLIGNLPGTPSLYAGLYIFYNVSSWITETTLDFTTLSPSVIDVSGVSGMDYNISACWGENNFQKNDIVLIQRSYGGAKWAKLLLGMGANQLDGGTYDSNHSGQSQYNGTFKVIMNPIAYEEIYDDNGEVTQGMDYAFGRPYTSNGHNEIRGFIWELKNGAISRKQIQITPYEDDGTVDYCVSEGLCIHNGYIYQGAIKTDSSHSSATSYKIIKYPILQ